MSPRNLHGNEVAVKFLTRLERYERFRREVEFHRGRPGHAGVLPLLDAYPPDKPSSDDYPWLSMPRGMPIDAALDKAPLEGIVAAIAAIADTLAGLARDDVHPRDLKPGNLYRYEDRRVVGDFGLIYLPELESLSRSDEVIGPFGYMPSELFIDPDNADPERVDVYELAKTLWVLATESLWPPQGMQRPSEDGTSISRYRFHRLADQFDRLVALGTSPAAERPAMGEFAAQLRAWLELQRSQPVEPEMDEILARLRDQSRGYVDETTQRARLGQAFEESWRELAEMLLVARLETALHHINPNQRNVLVADILRSSFEPTGPEYDMLVRDSWAAMASFGFKHNFVSAFALR